jgi:hypothetical protein
MLLWLFLYRELALQSTRNRERFRQIRGPPAAPLAEHPPETADAGDGEGLHRPAHPMRMLRARTTLLACLSRPRTSATSAKRSSV